MPAPVRWQGTSSTEHRLTVPPEAGLALAVVAVAGAYAGLYAAVAFETSFGASVGAAFWPPAGLTVAVLVLRPVREWRWFLLAVVIAETVMDVLYGFRPAVSVAMGVANAAEPLAAALLVRRWFAGRAPDLSQIGDLARFLLAAAVAGPLLGATVGATAPLVLVGDPLWPRVGRWYLGDALGVLVIAPLIVSVARPPVRSLLNVSAAWTIGLAIAVAVVAVGPWNFAARIGLPFLVIPCVALVGMQMGTRAAAATMLAIGVLVESVTAVGSGPFAGNGALAGLLVAQMYLATCALTALIAAALMTGLVREEHLALHDSLTGLANRRLLRDRIEVACRRLARQPGRVGVLYLDLDGFKTINDRYGHAAGDAVLVATAERLRAAVREQDTIARVGGDEFIVLIDHGATDDVLTELSARIDERIAEPVELDDIPLNVVASIGVAVTERADQDPDALVHHADRRMYEAKHGRSRYRVH